LRDKVLEEWRKPDGHPDTVWTKKYFEDLNRKQEEEREKFWEAVEDLKRIKEEKEFEKTKKLIETPTITFTPKPHKKRIETESSVKTRKINVLPILLILGLFVGVGIFAYFSSVSTSFIPNISLNVSEINKVTETQTNIPILSRRTTGPLVITVEGLETVEGCDYSLYPTFHYISCTGVKLKFRNIGNNLVYFGVVNPAVVLSNGQQLGYKISTPAATGCDMWITAESLYPNAEKVFKLCFPLFKKEDKPVLYFNLQYSIPSTETIKTEEYSIELWKYMS
jgi:hypothetical protein